MSKLARRQFLKLSAAAAAGALVVPAHRAQASDLPQLSEDDPMAKTLKYTHDASTVDPSTRQNPAADQNCANCQLFSGGDAEWGPCSIFPGKAVSAKGWCATWVQRAG